MAAELLHLNKTNWSGLRLGLIEELEAHLHPQAQMQVIQALQNQDQIQLILTTHSPNLASKLKIENLVMCSGNKAYPMGSKYTELDSCNYIFLEKFLDTTKANLFFAKGVIFVEGWAEEIIIPNIARHSGIDLTEKGIAIVNISGLAFAHYSKIFMRKKEPYFDIPVAIITDSDVAEYEETEDSKITKRDESIIQAELDQKIKEISANEIQSIKYFICPKWTFEYSAFHSTSLSTCFQGICKEVHTGSKWESDFEASLAKKLLNRTFKKTEIAYRLAASLDKDFEEKKLGKKEKLDIVIDSENREDKINYILKAIKYVTRN
jgi:putative ATP-dependent endonuclease of OLD family